MAKKKKSAKIAIITASTLLMLMVCVSFTVEIFGNKNISKTTSYTTNSFLPDDEIKDNRVTMLAVGDLMLDRYVKKIIDKKGAKYPFEKIEKLLSGNDLTLANLEGSFTDFKPKALNPNNTTFTFDPALIPTLKELGFNIFNLANNHSLNFGETGFTQSKKYLGENSIDYFGEPMNKEKISIIKNIRGTKIGFIGYNGFDGANFDNVLNEIKKLKPENDFVVVFTHWGIEYQTNFSKTQQKLGHEIIDAGADIIIGTHPHVVQPAEKYKDKMIFYSLGNFLFDQTFSKKTQEGLAVGIIFDKPDIKYYLFPTEIKKFQVEVKPESKVVSLHDFYF
ncbi:CapA family protein [Candidatus Peregrinibacteria bacterium]|nr:CapA family protein [Candidatus Peregrinibacteria bacterium]